MVTFTLLPTQLSISRKALRGMLAGTVAFVSVLLLMLHSLTWSYGRWWARDQNYYVPFWVCTELGLLRENKGQGQGSDMDVKAANSCKPSKVFFF